MEPPPPRPAHRPSRRTTDVSDKDVKSSPEPQIAGTVDNDHQPARETRPPPRPARRPIQIQPADPDPPQLREKSELLQKLISLDTPDAANNPEAVETYTKVSKALEEEGPGGATSSALRIPALGPMKKFDVPVSEGKVEQKAQDLTSDGADTPNASKDGEPKPAKEKEDPETSEVADKNVDNADVDAESNCSSEDAINKSEDKLTPIATDVDKSEKEPTESIGTASIAENQRVQDPVKADDDAQASDELQENHTVSDSPNTVKAEEIVEEPKPDVASSAISKDSVSESSETIRSPREGIVKGDKEDTMEEPSETSIERTISSVEDGTKDIEAAGEETSAVLSKEQGEERANDAESKLQNQDQEVSTRESPEQSTTTENSTPVDSVKSKKKEDSEGSTASDATADLKVKPSTAEAELKNDSSAEKPKPVTEKPAAEKQETEKPAAEKQDSVKGEFEPSKEKSAKSPPPRPPTAPKPKSKLASRFEAAIRESEAPKPKIAPKPKPRLGGGGRVAELQSAMFADLNAALSRGPPPAVRSRLDPRKPSELSSSTSSNDASVSEEAHIDDNESAENQISAMPKLPKSRVSGPGRRRRLPESVKPKLTVVLGRSPLWELSDEGTDSVSSVSRKTSDASDVMGSQTELNLRDTLARSLNVPDSIPDSPSSGSYDSGQKTANIRDLAAGKHAHFEDLQNDSRESSVNVPLQLPSLRNLVDRMPSPSLPPPQDIPAKPEDKGALNEILDKADGPHPLKPVTPSGEITGVNLAQYLDQSPQTVASGMKQKAMKDSGSYFPELKSEESDVAIEAKSNDSEEPDRATSASTTEESATVDSDAIGDEAEPERDLISPTTGDAERESPTSIQ